MTFEIGDTVKFVLLSEYFSPGFIVYRHRHGFNSYDIFTPKKRCRFSNMRLHRITSHRIVLTEKMFKIPPSHENDVVG